MKNKKILGTTLVVVTIILMAVSIAMIASVSFPRGQSQYNNNYYFVTRQAFWLFAGTIAFFIMSKIDYRRYKKLSGYLYLGCTILLIAVLIIGKEVNGAKRWIGIGSLSIQPSEFAKIVIILTLSSIIYNAKRKKIKNELLWLKMLVPFIIFAGLILLEKSFSSTVQIAVITLALFIVSEINIIYIISTLFGLFILGAGSIVLAEYRIKRIMEFFGGSSDRAYQENQSLIAIGSGGLTGRHYGNGLQKYFYLPEIHTDYIFSGYAEEMGFFGSLLLIILYMTLLTVIIITIFKIKDKFAKYVLIGILAMFFTQIAGNLCVVLGLIPSTGITLPILSYGGSTTLTVMAALGIVYNIIKALYKQEINKEN